jgi:hypothetical protein
MFLQIKALSQERAFFNDLEYGALAPSVATRLSAHTPPSLVPRSVRGNRYYPWSGIVFQLESFAKMARG